MGGMDIFRAEKTGENTWGHVENMKSPINSAGDDFSIVFDGDEDRGFFTSNRPGGKGKMTSGVSMCPIWSSRCKVW